jgi:hypothetical protein
MKAKPILILDAASVPLTHIAIVPLSLEFPYGLLELEKAFHDMVWHPPLA